MIYTGMLKCVCVGGERWSSENERSRPPLSLIKSNLGPSETEGIKELAWHAASPRHRWKQAPHQAQTQPLPANHLGGTEPFPNHRGEGRVAEGQSLFGGHEACTVPPQYPHASAAQHHRRWGLLMGCLRGLRCASPSKHRSEVASPPPRRQHPSQRRNPTKEDLNLT